jgi:hypothetical protein
MMCGMNPADAAITFFRPPFRNYQFDGAYNEMFAGPGIPREQALRATAATVKMN